MTDVSNDKLTMNKDFNEKGKFAKGNTISRCKRNHSEKKKLTIALGRAGRKQTPPIEWWDKVAETAFVDKEIMKTVINKLVPNINEITGADSGPISIILRKIIYGKEEKSKSGEAET